MITSKEIKNYLKENGIDTKKVSVKELPSSYSQAFQITIKSSDIDIEEVEKLSQHFKNYETDERTGEILQGGNTFVFVEYDYNTIKEVNQKYNDVVIDIMQEKLTQHCKYDIDAWNNGDGAVKISKNIMIYKSNGCYEIRNLEDYKTLRSGKTYFAETLLKLGKLNEVLKGEME